MTCVRRIKGLRKAATFAKLSVGPGEVANYTGVSASLQTKMCVAAFETQLSELTVEIAKPRVLEIVKDIKVTFPDMLGTIGGTIGLFTGLSLVSVIEVIYWVYRALMAYFSRSINFVLIVCKGNSF